MDYLKLFKVNQEYKLLQKNMTTNLGPQNGDYWGFNSDRFDTTGCLGKNISFCFWTRKYIFLYFFLDSQVKRPWVCFQKHIYS